MRNEQLDFRKGRRAQVQITNMKWALERAAKYRIRKRFALMPMSM